MEHLVFNSGNGFAYSHVHSGFVFTLFIILDAYLSYLHLKVQF